MVATYPGLGCCSRQSAARLSPSRRGLPTSIQSMSLGAACLVGSITRLVQSAACHLPCLACRSCCSLRGIQGTGEGAVWHPGQVGVPARLCFLGASLAGCRPACCPAKTGGSRFPGVVRTRDKSAILTSNIHALFWQPASTLCRGGLESPAAVAAVHHPLQACVWCCAGLCVWHSVKAGGAFQRGSWGGDICEDMKPVDSDVVSCRLQAENHVCHCSNCSAGV